jgi:2'-hydroxyisoflavone reductase
VRTTCEILKGNVGQYLFVSSTGVYHPYLELGIDEQGTLGTMEDPTVEEITGDTFGPLKVLCEQVAERWFPGRTTVIRPHLIVGPGDNSDRFTYWPVRIARGGEILVPGNPDDPVQLIDVRDLARFCILTLEEGFTGPFNVVGPYSPLTIAGLLHGIRATVSNEISFTWVDQEFLEAQEVNAWSNLPVWIPPEGEYLGMCSIDGSLAVAKGLNIRPLAETSQDTLAWWQTQSEDRQKKPRAGLSAEREAEVLAAWHAQE